MPSHCDTHSIHLSHLRLSSLVANNCPYLFLSVLVSVLSLCARALPTISGARCPSIRSSPRRSTPPKFEPETTRVKTPVTHFLAIQEPGLSKYCSRCRTEYINEETVARIHEGSLCPLFRNLFEAFDTCLYCGGKFQASI